MISKKTPVKSKVISVHKVVTDELSEYLRQTQQIVYDVKLDGEKYTVINCLSTKAELTVRCNNVNLSQIKSLEELMDKLFLLGLVEQNLRLGGKNYIIWAMHEELGLQDENNKGVPIEKLYQKGHRDSVSRSKHYWEDMTTKLLDREG